MNILLWHVHGSWTTAFVQGPHRYLLPTLPERGPDGRGRAETWSWPPGAIELRPEEAARADVDLVLLQRPVELDSLVERWLGGRRPGRDLPAVYLEHNAPQGPIAEMRHPAADRPDLVLVHVTHFNRLFWDSGSTPTEVIEHGIVDPGYRYTGRLPRAAVVINEPERRGRVVGADLLDRLQAPFDLFGMGTARPLPQDGLHDEMARRRLYLHPFRWTSLGLSLIEAMQLGMPVVALATTEVPAAVPRGCGIVSNRFEQICEAVDWLIREPEQARRMGAAARSWAVRHYGLGRFLADWDSLLARAAGASVRQKNPQ